MTSLRHRAKYSVRRAVHIIVKMYTLGANDPTRYTWVCFSTRPGTLRRTSWRTPQLHQKQCFHRNCWPHIVPCLGPHPATLQTIIVVANGSQCALSQRPLTHTYTREPKPTPTHHAKLPTPSISLAHTNRTTPSPSKALAGLM